MTERLTDDTLNAAIRRYVAACHYAGVRNVTSIGPFRVQVAAPYGQRWYVLRRTEDGAPEHDLPGFTTMAGFATRRQAHDALEIATRVLYDLPTLTRARTA